MVPGLGKLLERLLVEAVEPDREVDGEVGAVVVPWEVALHLYGLLPCPDLFQAVRVDLLPCRAVQQEPVRSTPPSGCQWTMTAS